MGSTRMSVFSPEELRGQIAAGRYPIDSGALAEDILSKFATIRRVRRVMMGEDEEASAGEAGRAAQSRARRGSRPASLRPRPSRSERLP